MNPLETATPEEAINLEPLTRFKYREVYEGGSTLPWIVRCGHRSRDEHYGEGSTLKEAIFNAGIDDLEQTFTD
jgi:hypothetical protein